MEEKKTILGVEIPEGEEISEETLAELTGGGDPEPNEQ